MTSRVIPETTPVAAMTIAIATRTAAGMRRSASLTGSTRANRPATSLWERPDARDHRSATSRPVTVPSSVCSNLTVPAPEPGLAAGDRVEQHGRTVGTGERLHVVAQRRRQVEEAGGLCCTGGGHDAFLR